MTAEVLLGFIATCILLAVTPGPNMALILSSTLGGGLREGLVTLSGCLTGLAILVIVATVGMTSVMLLMSEWFDWVRFAGAVYLVYLGVRQLLQYWRRRDGVLPAVPAVSAGSRYVQGVLVALSNPKVLLFLGAFFPQFVNANAPIGPQLVVLAITFIATLMIVDLSYTVAAAKARRSFDPRRLGMLDAASGVLLLAGGLVLATARRP